MNASSAEAICLCETRLAGLVARTSSSAHRALALRRGKERPHSHNSTQQMLDEADKDAS